jgi:hypothetical protein
MNVAVDVGADTVGEARQLIHIPGGDGAQMSVEVAVCSLQSVRPLQGHQALVRCHENELAQWSLKAAAL